MTFEVHPRSHILPLNCWLEPDHELKIPWLLRFIQEFIFYHWMQTEPCHDPRISLLFGSIQEVISYHCIAKRTWSWPQHFMVLRYWIANWTRSWPRIFMAFWVHPRIYIQPLNCKLDLVMTSKFMAFEIHPRIHILPLNCKLDPVTMEMVTMPNFMAFDE